MQGAPSIETQRYIGCVELDTLQTRGNGTALPTAKEHLTEGLQLGVGGKRGGVRTREEGGLDFTQLRAWL